MCSYLLAMKLEYECIVQEVEEETPYGMDLVWGVVMAEIEKVDK